LNLIASPEGIGNFVKKFPKLRVVTAFIDKVSEAPLSSSLPGLTVYRDSTRKITLCLGWETLVIDSTLCRLHRRPGPLPPKKIS